MELIEQFLAVSAVLLFSALLHLVRDKGRILLVKTSPAGCMILCDTTGETRSKWN